MEYNVWIYVRMYEVKDGCCVEVVLYSKCVLIE
jgi:hypothetical protein